MRRPASPIPTSLMRRGRELEYGTRCDVSVAARELLAAKDRFSYVSRPARVAPRATRSLQRLTLLQHAGRTQRSFEPLRTQIPAGNDIGDARALIREFRCRQLQQRLSLFTLDDHDAIAITHDQVARIDRHAAAGDRPVDAAGDELGRSVGVRSHRINRKAQLAQLLAVAMRAIEDHARNA